MLIYTFLMYDHPILRT